MLRFSRTVLSQRISVLLPATLIAGNCLWFSLASLRSHFAPDEMMNMYWAVDAGLSRIATHIFCFFKPFYRPTGAFYYWSLFHLFRLDPLPYRILDLGVVLANIGLVYALIRQLSPSRTAHWIASFGALLFSYHEKIMIWAIYNGAWVYDRLCFLFGFGFLLLYARLRLSGSRLHAANLAGLVALFLLALGAKEMAAVLPVHLIAFEVCFRRHLARISIGNVGLLVVLSLASLFYAYGKLHGPGALAANPGYHLKAATLQNYLAAQARHLQDYLFLENPVPTTCAYAILLGILIAVLLARSPLVSFAFAYLLISPLPIAFVDRGGGALYLPWFGWCAFAVALLARLVEAACRYRRHPVDDSSTIALYCLSAFTVFGLLFTVNVHYWKHEQPAMLTNGDVTWRMIQDLNRIRPIIKTGDRVLVAKNPFAGWDMHFILSLWSHPEHPTILLIGKNVQPDHVPSDMRVVVGIDQNGRLVSHRPAE